jgi:hypothetical protein
MYLIDKYFFKARRDALRVQFWRFLLKYRTSYPYLSGDSFAKLCDYSAYGKDGSKPINLGRLKKSKVLFVPGHKLEDLLSNHFEHISAKVLICGNSDHNFTADPILPDSIQFWLCQNYAVGNGFGQVIPIGLENLRLGKSGFKKYQKLSGVEKIFDKILVPPMQITNPIRAQVLEKCKTRPDVFDVFEDYLGTPNYFRLIERYKFVLVLEGNGFDTHRLWEVIYKGNIPILLDSPWSRNISALGIPCYISQSFEDLNAWAVQNGQLFSGENPILPSVLYMQYWAKLVNRIGDSRR